MLCNRWKVFVCGVAILLTPRPNFTRDPSTNPGWKNADFVIFQDSISSYDSEVEVSSEDRSEAQKWYLALRKTAMLLPTSFVETIATDFYDPGHPGICTGSGCAIRFKFFINSVSWVTAYPDAINLRPSATELPYWLTWEPFPKDGYSEEERIWIALHEFAHRYQFSPSGNFFDSFGIESPTTLYGCHSWIETFADTFAMYVVFPEQLRRFPLSYNGVRRILRREYEAQFQIPNSVASKLTDPIDGCEQYDEQIMRIKKKKFF